MIISHTFTFEAEPGDIITLSPGIECMVYAITPDKITLCMANIMHNTNILELTPEQFFARAYDAQPPTKETKMKTLTPLGNVLFFILCCLAFWSVLFFGPGFINSLFGG